MFAPERQQAILGRARSAGRVDVNDLAGAFDVTPETIRRDLTGLERRGVLRRVHGGAIPVERLGIEPAVDERYDQNAAEKERIAKAALDHLPDGGSIIIDAGTTTVRFAEMLPTDRPFTVVTHCAADRRRAGAQRRHHPASGRRPGPRPAPWPRSAAGQSGNWPTCSPTSCSRRPTASARAGLSTPDLAEAAVKRALIRSARRTVVLADHSKFGRDEFAQVADLSEVDTIITDSEVDADMAREIEDAGPEVIRV